MQPLFRSRLRRRILSLARPQAQLAPLSGPPELGKFNEGCEVVHFRNTSTREFPWLEGW